MASFSTHTTLMVATVSLFIMAVFASFDPSSSSNVAIYWGQNSYSTAAGASNAQQRLSYYCSNIDIDIIPLAFLDEINTPLVNFANADDSCTVFSGTTLLECPQLEEDIQTCQYTYGKTIMLSIGGATYTEGGFSSTSAASVAADTIWAMFGPEQSNSSVNRPFGKAVVDGFDFDFESATSNMVSFASELRSKMDAATAEGDKSYYLSAAPQCPYPDAADNDMLAGEVSFDFVMVQFYNNYCGLQSYASGSSTQSSFNFGSWDDWARTSSKNPNVRVFLGIPGSSTAAGSGYVSDSSLASIITYSKTFSSFGGVMAWDMSQVYANPGFLELITDSLQSGAASPNTTASTSMTSEPATSGSVWPTYTTSTFATYRTSPREVSATPLLPYTPAPAPPAGSTFTTKTTSSRQVHSSLAPTTLSTATRSAVPSDWSAAKGTGSCVTPSAATVTSYVTVAKSASLSSNFGATKGTLNSSPAQPTTVRGETTVAQWGQCGGVGYSGSTQCESPYICVANSKWWAQCQ